ncbi:glycine--tRNA ligase subunit beta, partial [Enterococcus faecium]
KDQRKVFAAAQLLKQHLADEDFKPSMEPLTRVVNLAKKAQLEKQSVVDPELFENEAEKELHKAVEAMKARFADQTIHDYYD